MSHCLNEVKSVTLINCRNNLIFIIVVCPWTMGRKGKNFKNFDEIFFLIDWWYTVGISFPVERLQDRVLDRIWERPSGNKNSNDSFIQGLLFLENAISELIIYREFDLFCSFIKCYHQWRTWNFSKRRYISRVFSETTVRLEPRRSRSWT